MKRDGDLNGAIDTLQAAYVLMARESTIYRVDTYLRLPLYLQAAGRNDEAWSEFNRLISEGYPNQLSNFSIQTMEHSKIYNKMRLFLQREGKYDKAIVQGMLADLAWCRGLHMQGRAKEFAEHTSEAQFEKTLEPLVKKAGKSDCVTELVEIMRQAVSHPSRVDLAAAAKSAAAVINRSDSA